MHHVWLTHSSNPLEIIPSDIKNIINTKTTFGNDLTKWKHIVWTNNKNLIPISIKVLEENGLEVRSIEDYKE